MVEKIIYIITIFLYSFLFNPENVIDGIRSSTVVILVVMYYVHYNSIIAIKRDKKIEEQDEAEDSSEVG